MPRALRTLARNAAAGNCAGVRPDVECLVFGQRTPVFVPVCSLVEYNDSPETPQRSVQLFRDGHQVLLAYIRVFNILV